MAGRILASLLFAVLMFLAVSPAFAGCYTDLVASGQRVVNVGGPWSGSSTPQFTSQYSYRNTSGVPLEVALYVTDGTGYRAHASLHMAEPDTNDADGCPVGWNMGGNGFCQNVTNGDYMHGWVWPQANNGHMCSWCSGQTAQSVSKIVPPGGWYRVFKDGSADAQGYGAGQNTSAKLFECPMQ